MNVTRTPYSWFLLLSRESYDPETQWDVGKEREGVVVDRSKKGDGERGWMRFKGGGKRREKRERERERVRVRSKVRLLFMMLFPRNNRDFRKSAIALPVDPFACFLST